MPGEASKQAEASWDQPSCAGVQKQYRNPLQLPCVGDFGLTCPDGSRRRYPSGVRRAHSSGGEAGDDERSALRTWACSGVREAGTRTLTEGSDNRFDPQTQERGEEGPEGNRQPHDAARVSDPDWAGSPHRAVGEDAGGLDEGACPAGEEAVGGEEDQDHRQSKSYEVFPKLRGGTR